MYRIYSWIKKSKINDYFSNETLRFIVASLLVPNIIYLLFNIIYSPPRSEFILFIALICIFGLFIPRLAFFLILSCIMLLDIATFVSRYFQMPLPMLIDSMKFLGELNIFQSMTYLAVLGVLILSFTVTFNWVTEIKKNRARISLVPFLFAALVLSGLDYWVNASPQNVMKLKMQFSERFTPIEDAASLKSGVVKSVRSSQRNDVLIVMVEGLGAFTSPELQNIVWGPLLDEAILTRYELEQGTTHYFGSTTSGEARELCNLNADYRDFRDKSTSDCLPSLAKEAGYRTAAFHAFTKEFFERADWFPKIGFEELFFLENSAGLRPAEPLDHCGITFRGLCDTDVSKSVEAYLSQDHAEPKFVYWLTLNSHKPVMPGEVPERLDCEDGGVFQDRELCLMSEQWLNVSHLVRRIALNENLRNTEILLVGDHHPPLFTRKARRLFKPGEVAWLHLKRLSDREDKKLAAVRRHEHQTSEN